GGPSRKARVVPTAIGSSVGTFRCEITIKIPSIIQVPRIIKVPLDLVVAVTYSSSHHAAAAPRACAVFFAACFLAACGGSERTPSLLHNQRPVPGTREVATNYFEIDHEVLDKALTTWAGLAAGANVRWIEGGRVPNLDKGKAWPAVAL